MALVLLPVMFDEGLQTQVQFLLTALKRLNDTTLFPDPFDVLDLKTDLDSGQPSTFELANFDSYVSNIYSLSLNLDTTVLSVSEASRLNIIREYLQAPPTLACCQATTATALLTTMAVEKRVGSATFEYTLEVQFDPSVQCEAASVQVTIVPTGGAPAATVPIVTLYPLGCFNNKWVFQKNWIDFVGDPSTKTYAFDLVVKDSLGVLLAGYPKAGFVFP